jgi:uncharacterized protein
MKQRITPLLAGGLLALSLFGVAAAGQYEDGLDAYLRKDYAEAMRLMRPIAEQGKAGAQVQLGTMYCLGLSVQQDYAQALAWYRKAADQGDDTGQYELGLMYEGGPGVQQDYAQAEAWHRKAAGQGNVLARLELGFMYEKGLGVLQDYVTAHMWFNLAASHVNIVAPSLSEQAAKYRDELAAKMTPAQIAEAQRMARERMPK